MLSPTGKRLWEREERVIVVSVVPCCRYGEVVGRRLEGGVTTPQPPLVAAPLDCNCCLLLEAEWLRLRLERSRPPSVLSAPPPQPPPPPPADPPPELDALVVPSWKVFFSQSISETIGEEGEPLLLLLLLLLPFVAGETFAAAEAALEDPFASFPPTTIFFAAGGRLEGEDGGLTAGARGFLDALLRPPFAFAASVERAEAEREGGLFPALRGGAMPAASSALLPPLLPSSSPSTASA